MPPIIANPPVDIEAVSESLQTGDIRLSADQLGLITVFDGLKSVPNFDRLPGSTVLRHCQPGRVMCHQADAGATAFYILPPDDVVEILESRQASGETSPDLTARITSWKGRAALAASDGPRQEVARAIISRGVEERPRQGFIARLFGGRRHSAIDTDDTGATTIAADLPTDIDLNSGHAPLHEAEIFGEMSCMNRAPRSATVVVTQECYMLEFVSNVLNSIKSDPQAREKLDQVYRERVLDSHIRRLSFFDKLSNEQFQALKEEITLIDRKAGDVILDEHDEQIDCVYVVRSGMVKVVTNAGILFGKDEITDRQWGLLPQRCRVLNESEDPALQSIWQAFPENLRKQLTAVTGEFAAELRNEFRLALNRFIQDEDFVASLGKPAKKKDSLIDFAGMQAFAETLAGHDEKTEDWSGEENRIFQRLLLESAFPRELPRHAQIVANRRIQAYVGRGAIIGEMGVIDKAPRTSTCIAFDHPDNEQRRPGDEKKGLTPSHVELVRIDAHVLRDLLKGSDALKSEVQSVVAERRQQNRAQLTRSSGPTPQLAQFEKLGLGQGQELLLVDLAKCTRCGECITACSDNHNDNRTRLYLEGPRIDQYLVPLSCRSCRDPVCMIGCPVSAIIRGSEGQMEIKNWCIGCSLCADQCPYGSIQMHLLDEPAKPDKQADQYLVENAEFRQVTERAAVCDLCAATPLGEPACVYACPHDAAIRVDGLEFFRQS